MLEFPPERYRHNLEERYCSESEIVATASRIEAAAGEHNIPFKSQRIGKSRAGRDIWGFMLGSGSRHVSITAGAHSDEPIGPITALALAEWLVSLSPGNGFTEHHTFRICPQVNPDGAEENRVWFGDPIDPIEYFKHSMREPPGDDVEFGYPDPNKTETDDTDSGQLGLWGVRPENMAVASFLAESGPYSFHSSLHGMAFAEGAWFLIGAGWAARSLPLRHTLAELAQKLGFGLHDIERRGEKGFTRIAPGFCTTPTSIAMKDYFHAHHDPATAKLFRLSSMEFVQSLGGDPLLMVSELPLFLIGEESTRDPLSGPPPLDTPYVQFRAALAKARASALDKDLEPLQHLIGEHHLRPAPLASQIKLQGLMVIEALRFLEHLADSKHH